MDFKKLIEKKKDNLTVWVTLADDEETTEVTYVKIKDVCIKEQTKSIHKHLNETYGKNGWLAYNID